MPSPSSFTLIRKHLGRVRRRFRLAHVVENVALLGFGSVGLVALGAVLAWSLEPAHVDVVRVGLLAVLGVAFLLLAWRGALPWRQSHGDERVARFVEREVPALSGGVLSAIELEQRLDRDLTSLTFSPGMVLAHADDISRRLTAIHPRALVSFDRPGRAIGAFVGLGALVTGLTLLIEPLRDGFIRLAHGAPARLAAAEEVLLERDILVGDIDYTLSLPAYTREKPRSVHNSNGDLAALVGTRVHIETRALLPAVAASIVFDDPRPGGEILPPIRLEIGPDGQTLSGELTVRLARRFRFQITTRDSGLVSERASRMLDALPDAPPSVEIVEPEGDVEVRSLDPVRLAFHLADDYGLGGLDIVTQKGDGPEPPTKRRVAALVGDRTWVGASDVDLQRFQLEPGETLRVWVEAYDGNTVAEAPGRSRSREIRIRLHSPDEQHAANLEAQRALLDAMVDVLADRLESPVTERAKPRFDKAVEVQGKVVHGTAGLIDGLDALLKAMVEDTLAGEEVADALTDMRKRHAALYEVESRQMRDALQVVDDSERTPLFDSLGVSNDRGITELESDIPWLQRLLDEQDSKRLLQDAKALVSAERELRSLLEQLKKSDDPALRAEVQKRLQEILTQLDRMGKSMQRSARPAPFENMNYDALEPSDMRGLGDVRSSVERLMELVREGRIDEALAAVDGLGQAVQSVTSRLEDDIGPGGGGESVAGSPELRRLSAEVDKIAARQEALRKEGEALEDVARGQMSDRIKDTLAPEIARQMQSVGELRESLDSIDRKGLHADDQRRLDEIGRALDDARETLSHEDLGQASRKLGEAREGMEELGKELAREGPKRPTETPPGGESIAGAGPAAENEAAGEKPGYGGLGGAPGAAKTLSKLQTGARESERSLERMMPSPAELLDKGSQAALRELGKKQSLNAERVGQLESELDKLEAARPGSKGAVSPALERARQSMNEASKRFGQELQPGRGEAAAGEARDRLKEAREAIDQQLKQDKESSGGVGPTMSRNKVEIPDAERYSVPKEFREELLKSLKEGAPPIYRSLVERYYEALVQ